VENFHAMGFFIHDIDYVIVTHDHVDHAFDVEKIIDLSYQLKIAKIQYYLDLSTYGKYYKRINDESTQNGHNAKRLDLGSEDSQNEIEITENISLSVFETDHCPHSVGIKLTLGQDEGKVIIGYTSDTAYSESISTYLDGSDIIIANFSETNTQDFACLEYKKSHLGFYGCRSLIDNIENPPHICIISEFWGGKGDIRTYIAKILKSMTKHEEVAFIPSDIGLTILLDKKQVLCSKCEKWVDAHLIKSVRPNMRDSFGQLDYVCSLCL